MRNDIGASKAANGKQLSPSLKQHHFSKRRFLTKISQQEGAGPSFNVAVDAVDVCSWMRWPKIRGIERERKKVVVLPPAVRAWRGRAWRTYGLDKSIRGVERVGKRVGGKSAHVESCC